MPEVIMRESEGSYELHDNGGIWWVSQQSYIIPPGSATKGTLKEIKSGYYAQMRWLPVEPISLENE